MDAELLVLPFWGLSIFAAIWVPGWLKRSHVARQSKLLDRCRAIYLAAVQLIERNEAAMATLCLRRIRCIEAYWRVGNSLMFRIALFLYAVFVGFLISIALRVGPLILIRVQHPGQRYAPLLDGTLLVIGLLPLGWAMLSYWTEWGDEYVLADCGDRLERFIASPRQVIFADATATTVPPELDGLSALQIFGLSPSFTRQELDEARRRLAMEFHPDRWATKASKARLANEAAMKRVNQAHDELIKSNSAQTN